MQCGLAVAELLQRADGGDDIVAIGAGLAVPLANVVQLLVERKPTGILHVPAVDHVTQCRHPLLRVAPEPDRARAFAIDRGDLFACAQISDGPRALGCAHAVSNAATGSTPVETKHQARPLGCSAVDEGIDAQGSMSADEARLDP